MKKLTKSEIAKIFQVDEEVIDEGTSYHKIIEKREKEFVDKILKPWLAKILKKGNLTNGQKKTSCEGSKD